MRNYAGLFVVFGHENYYFCRLCSRHDAPCRYRHDHRYCCSGNGHIQMKIIDAKELGLKILRFDVQKYPNTNSKAVIRREFKFIAGDRRFECVVSAREAKTATDALLQAAERLRSAQNVIFTNLPRVQIVSDKTVCDWLGTNSA